MNKEKIYSGTSKSLYTTDDDYTLLLSFNDNMRMPQADSVEISGKGVLCNSISALLMEKLDLVGIEHHFLKKLNMRQQLVHFVDIYPVQACISNVAVGRYVEDFGMDEGFVFDTPIIDYRVKNSKLAYPVINESQIVSFDWMTKAEIRDLQKQTMRVHDFLSGLFAGVGIRLVESYLEFGRIFNGEESIIVLSDELSPDNLRLWDMETNRKLSFEVAQENQDAVIPAYKEVLERLEGKVQK